MKEDIVICPLCQNPCSFDISKKGLKKICSIHGFLKYVPYDDQLKELINAEENVNITVEDVKKLSSDDLKKLNNVIEDEDISLSINISIFHNLSSSLAKQLKTKWIPYSEIKNACRGLIEESEINDIINYEYDSGNIKRESGRYKVVSITKEQGDPEKEKLKLRIQEIENDLIKEITSDYSKNVNEITIDEDTDIYKDYPFSSELEKWTFFMEQFPFSKPRDSQRQSIPIIWWALKNYDYVFFEAPTGSGKCLDENSLIYSNNGIKKIKDISPNDKIKSFSINSHQIHNRSIKHKFDKKMRECVKIQTDSGLEISGTPEHRIAIMNQNGHIFYEELKHIKKNTSIPIIYNTNIFGQDKFINFKFLPHPKRPTGPFKVPFIPNKIDKNLALIIGYLIGDGTVTYKRTVSLTNIDSTIVNNFTKVINSYGLSINKNGISYRCSSVWFRKYLEKIGVEYKTATQKTIPEMILKGSFQTQKYFLRGLFDTDGGMKPSSVHLYTSSKRLANQVQIMLLNIGIISHVRYKKVKYTYKNKTSYKDSYILSIYGEFISVFYQTINFGHPSKKEKLRKYIHHTQETAKNPNKGCVPHIWMMIDKIWKEFAQIHFRIRNPDCIRSYKNRNKWYNPGPYEIIKQRGITNKNLSPYRMNPKTNKQTRNPSISKLKKILQCLKEVSYMSEYKYLEKICNLNVYFDIVTKTEKIGTKHVYDLNISQIHSYICSGFISHNSASYMTLLKKFENGYVDTHRIGLQNQLMKDFSEMLQMVVGRKNFSCFATDAICAECKRNEDDKKCPIKKSKTLSKIYDKCPVSLAPCIRHQSFSCDYKPIYLVISLDQESLKAIITEHNGVITLQDRKFILMGETTGPGEEGYLILALTDSLAQRTLCPYWKQVLEALDNNYSIINKFYLISESSYVGKFKPREILISDECLPKDTNIWTQIGQKKIIEMKSENAKVYSLKKDGNYKLNKYKFKKTRIKPIIVLTTETGTKLRCSPDHSVFTSQHQKKLASEAENLFYSLIRPKNYKRQAVYCRLFGYILGDGFLGNNWKHSGVSGRYEDLIQINKDIQYIGYPSSTYIQTRQLYSPEYKISGTCATTKFRLNFTNKLKKDGFPIGKKTDVQYKLPKWLMNETKENKKEFLAGFAGAEGYISASYQKSSFYASRISQYKREDLLDNGIKMMEQIQQLYHDVDIHTTTIRIRPGNQREDGTTSKHIELTIGNSNQNLSALMDIGIRYCIKKEKKGEIVRQYLLYKNQMINERKNFRKKIIKLKQKGYTHTRISSKMNITLSQVGNFIYRKDKRIISPRNIVPFTNWCKKVHGNFIQLNIIRKWHSKKEQTYNLEILAPEHNYIANGFLVSNCHNNEQVMLNFKSEAISQKDISQWIENPSMKLKGKNRNLVIEIPQIEILKGDTDWHDKEKLWIKFVEGLILSAQHISARLKLIGFTWDGIIEHRYNKFMDSLKIIKKILETDMKRPYPKYVWTFFYDVQSQLNTKGSQFKIKRVISRVEFKPIFANSYTPYIYTRLGKKVLFTSATIINPTNQTKLLGIDPEKSVMVRVDYSNFDINSRRIFVLRSIGAMNWKNKESTYPRVAEELEQLMDFYQGIHGLILCYTNEMETALTEGFRDNPRWRSTFPNPLLKKQYIERIIRHGKFNEEREMVISNFKKGLGPDGYDMYNSSRCQCRRCGMTMKFNKLFKMNDEGKYECSYCKEEFNVNCIKKTELVSKQVNIGVCAVLKLPFASLADIQVAKRKDINPIDYTIDVMQKIMQMSGRTVRSEEDFSDIIIFDYAIDFLIKKHGYMFPQHIRKAITPVDRVSDMFRYNTIAQQNIKNHPKSSEMTNPKWLITTYGNEGEDFANQVICEKCFGRSIIGSVHCSECNQPIGGSTIGRGKMLNYSDHEEKTQPRFAIQRKLNFDRR